MKTKIIFALILALGYLSLSSTILNLPECIQEQTNWCWAGSSQAILHYYNMPVTQVEIAQYGTEGANEWNWLYGSSELPTRRGIDMILDHFAGLQSIAGDYIYALPYSEVVAEIDSLQPFVTRIGWTTGGGHFIDCYGYEQNNLYLMDPWPGNGYTIYDYNYYSNGSPDFAWTHTLTLNSGVGLRAYFNAVPHSGYAPLTVSFNDLSLGSPTGWLWDFDNDGISDCEIQNPVWSFALPGTYTISLTVTQGTESHTYIRENYIDVVNNPPVIINNIPDLTMNINTAYPAINLYEVFYDAENDSLFFTFHNPQNHINGTISNDFLSITPDLNWTGTTLCYVQCTDNNFHLINDMFYVTVSDSTGIEDDNNLSMIPTLNIYPNPCRIDTNIKISNPTEENLALSMYNCKGQKVAAWIVGAKDEKSLSLNGSASNSGTFVSGIYYLKLDAGSYHTTRKILYLR